MILMLEKWPCNLSKAVHSILEGDVLIYIVYMISHSREIFGYETNTDRELWIMSFTKQACKKTESKRELFNLP